MVRFIPAERKVLVGPASIEPKITIEIGLRSGSSSSALAAEIGAAAKLIADKHDAKADKALVDNAIAAVVKG